VSSSLRLKAVKKWLEETAPSLPPVETHQGYLYYTRKAQNEDVDTLQAMSLDIDGTIRERTTLVKEDQVT
jgi:hypothetical protein